MPRTENAGEQPLEVILADNLQRARRDCKEQVQLKLAIACVAVCLQLPANLAPNLVAMNAPRRNVLQS